jgi:hypothetical protein
MAGISGVRMHAQRTREVGVPQGDQTAGPGASRRSSHHSDAEDAARRTSAAGAAAEYCPPFVADQM